MKVLAFLITLPILCHANQTEYFVKPDDSTPCPEPPCYTVFHYLESSTHYFASNTRVSFLPGVHVIDKILYIENVSNLTFAGYNVSSSHATNSAKIVCIKPAALSFVKVVNLVIKHLSIINCGYPLSNGKSAAVYMREITSLQLLSISVEKSVGYGMYGINILGNSSVSHSRFIFNNYYTLRSTKAKCSSGPQSCAGGNMLLHYAKLSEFAVNNTGSTSVLSVDSCLFSHGVDFSSSSSKLSGGLSIFNSTNRYSVDISIHNVVSTRNVANMGTNFYFVNIWSLNIINSTSSMANYLVQHKEVVRNSGMALLSYSELDPSLHDPTTDKIPLPLHILNSKFHDNNGGGLYISFQHYEAYNNFKYEVIIKNCSFQRNVNSTGSGIQIETSTSGLHVLIENTNFTNHTMPRGSSNIIFSTNPFYVITVNKLRHLKIINCTFEMNAPTALQAFDSTLYFGGQVNFSGNHGRLGGALSLQGGSRFYLMPHSHVQIINNHAKRGGGIYIEDENAASSVPCFFQLLDLQLYHSDINAMITLKNNTAEEAGTAVYGGNIDSCYLFTSSQHRVFNSTVFDTVFKIQDPSLSVSSVSSNPFTVYFCNHRRYARYDIHTTKVYPGQMFTVLVALHGQRNGSVPGIVRAKLLTDFPGNHLAPLQETQKIGNLCTNLSFTIFSNISFRKEVIRLRVDGIHYYESEGPVVILAWLLPCPPGFQLSNVTAQCECAPMLQDRGLLCNISGTVPLVQRTISTWISTHHNGKGILLHDHCPLHYCKPTQLWLHLDHPDEQCARGRSGILCGSCSSNLSLTVGTSQCLECTNAYLALLLPFSLAGLMLVLLLIICNLTVSMGTINGLIFYANIVWVNHANFFKTPNTFGVRVFQQVLAVFIAWLNLDLGIETCLFHGMDVYIQTWLQFAFPFYIWMIVGVIIYLSRRSITIVKLVGSSAVSVLATLFLLSYAKLQRTVITAFSFTYVQKYCGDGRPLTVWLYDGNVPFLQGKHIALFLMALAVTLLFILPFTLLLLFAPCIQASNHFIVQWVKMKLNPLLDAYQGPYKDNFRFWTGLMLVVRSILLVGFGLNILGNPDLNNFLIIVVLTCLVSCAGIRGIVYKNVLFHITEISFILNLIILSGWTIYNRPRPTGTVAGQAAVVCVSTGVAFATFICILAYHTYLRLKSTKLHLHFRRHQIERRDGREREAVEGSVESPVDAPPKRLPTVTMVELREPLLTDN